MNEKKTALEVRGEEKMMGCVEQELLSIIVPIYNVEEYLPRCLESIIGQTYKNIEIICVDDGSTDQSGSIADTYALNDERIQVVHKDNGGLVSARKAGISRANGQYIAFVDSDDYVDENMYQVMMKCMVELKVDFIHSGYVKEFGNTQSIMCDFENQVVSCSKNRKGFLLNNVFFSEKKQYISSSIWSKIFKSSIIKKAYSLVPDSQSYGEDLICLCACILEANTMAYVRGTSYHYVVRENSIITTASMKNLIREFELYKCLEKLFQEYDCLEALDSSLDKFLKSQVVNALSTMGEESVYVQQYNYNSISKLYHRKGVIYGAGKVGISYYQQLCNDQRCKVVCLVDAHPERYQYDFIQIIKPEELININFDYVLIAVTTMATAQNITENLIKIGIPKEKIIWEKPIKVN